MSNPTKSYFLAPNWDFPPGGPIALGSIIPDPARPGQSLNAGHRLSIPDSMLVTPTSKTSWEWTKGSAWKGKVGVWTRFLQVLGVSVDVGVEYDLNKDEVYTFDEITTETIVPTDEYVEQSMKLPGVARFITKSNFKKPVYMITALKTVHGAKVTKSKSQMRGVDSKVGVDGTLLAAPASIGPEFNIQREHHDSISFGGSSEFVFAFQVQKIHYSKKEHEIVHEEFNKGAMLGINSDGTSETQTESLVEIIKSASDDDETDGTKYKSFKDTVDDTDLEPCICIAPWAEASS